MKDIVKKIIESEPVSVRVAELVREVGGRAFFVGGCVRDALLGKSSKDVDIEVYGLQPEELADVLRKEFAIDMVGESFGVFKLHHHDIDIALPRRESKIGEGHKAFEIKPDANISYEDASARRDFTINAMMLDPLTAELIDPWGGLKDLKEHRLRHVSGHFVEDPLRVLRCMQFAARYDFEVDESTVEICSKMTPEGLSRERLAGEWEKLLLKGVKLSRGLEFLKDCGWIKYYPELKALIGCKQNPFWHPEGDVWTHTLIALDHLPEVRVGNDEEDLLVAVSVLCHDFGKPLTTYTNAEGKIVSPGHDVACEDEVRSFVSRLWNIRGFDDKVWAMVRSHMRPILLLKDGATKRAFRRLAVKVGNIELLSRVVECDLSACSTRDSAKEMVADFLQVASNYEVKNEPPAALILGRDLIAMGYSPCKEFGEVLDVCYNAQIDDKVTTREEVFVLAKEIAEKKGLKKGKDTNE